MKHPSSCVAVITLGAIGADYERTRLSGNSPWDRWKRAFHNLGVGWDSRTGRFKDKGRFAVTRADHDRGAFKTPTVRDVSLHPPYMHDGSVPTLRAVVELYNRGGIRNPHLDRKIKPLRLTDHEIDALVKFMEALTGKGYLDKPPNSFPSATHVQSMKEMTHGSNR